jgi:nicotinate-nucleotide adenylyltransferase
MLQQQNLPWLRMQSNKQRIGIFGGAFDPIHSGHIQVAQYCLSEYGLDQIRFIPSKHHRLKQTSIARPWQRAAMVALAIANHAGFYLDTRELLRQQPSYAILTLQSLCQQFPQNDFFWILGADAFADFNRWHQWQEIASLCDLLVVSRQAASMNATLKTEIELCFKQKQHQVIYLAMPLVDRASRVIRATSLQHQLDVPEEVWHFMIENDLYSEVKR